MQLVAKFEGGLADHHLVPAYEATETLYGITRSLIVPINYLIEGRVRRKNFEHKGYRLDLVTNRDGSFETIFDFQIDVPSIQIAVKTASEYAVSGVVGGFALDFVKHIFRKTVGEDGSENIEKMEQADEVKSGDVDAIVEAIEPAVRLAHRSIGRGANNIIIVGGENNVVNLNQKTKDYVNKTIKDEEVHLKRFSIGSFNANQMSGRAWDYDLERTVPFQMARNIDIESVEAISSSISNYALARMGSDLGSSVVMKYMRNLSVDGRVKSMQVLKARLEISEI